MAWTVDDIYKALKVLTRKNQSGGIRRDDLFYAWNIEQAMFHQDIVGRWQNRSNGKQGLNTGLIVNETSLTELAAFTIPATLTIAAGVANKPSDFIQRLALRINGKRVNLIRHDQIDSVNSSVIDPPSIADDCYYAVEYQNYYSFLPTTVTEAKLDYVAECTDIVWNFTLDGNGREVYSPTGSVQPKWDKHTVITITKRALTNLGVSFKDKDFENFGRIAQTTGD